jgi:hypothetical protein
MVDSTSQNRRADIIVIDEKKNQGIVLTQQLYEKQISYPRMKMSM